MRKNRGAILLISAINKEINFLFDNLLSELEITRTESLYLRIIYENPGITQYDIAKLRKLEKSLVTKYVTNLEDKGLIEKRPLDKRRKGLYLVEDGIKAIQFVDNFLPELQKKFKGIFSDEELKIFISYLEKLNTALLDFNGREF
ncbi:MAG: MarR family winged helix-turn-helix transcriptional regulator [Cetobacterium sp.]|uniref:MarR family winged helix-turn-helix transcriptional regulator n=1 Tax=Cetobacterium sp. TaxID=2071632 RepID=UPI003F394067